MPDDSPGVPLEMTEAIPPETDSAEAVAPEQVSYAETRRTLWAVAIAWGIFGSAHFTTIGGVAYVGFIFKLGVSNFVYGLLISLPFLTVLFQLFASYYVETHRRRRRFFLFMASGQRLTWLLVAALPWMIPPQYRDARVFTLLVFVMLASAFGNAASPAWTSWLGDMVPAHIRARYFGNRAALGTVTAIIVSALVGWILDHNKGYVVYSIIFASAALFGWCDMLTLSLVRERKMPPRADPPWRLRDVIKEPLRDKPFRGYLLYSFSSSWAASIAGPFFWRLAIQHLQIGNFWSNMYIMTVPMMFVALTLPLWGGICDRFSSKPVVALGNLLVMLCPMAWLIATHTAFHPALIAAAVISGIASAAIQVSELNMLFSLTPRQSRSAYMAMLAIASSLALAIAPILGGWLSDRLHTVHIHFAGREFISLHFLIIISMLARLLHLIFFVPRLPEPSQQGMGDIVKHIATSPARIAGDIVRKHHDKYNR
jgi:MFS family permease